MSSPDGATPAPAGEAAGALVPPWPRADIPLPDRTLAVRHAPPATPDLPPAVFVHGLGGSSLNWTDLMDLLRDKVDGYAPDLGGHGWSPPPRDGDYSPAGQARGIAQLIEHLDRGPVHLFGNSLGGAVAVQLAARRPDLVRTATLVSPALPTLRPQRTNAHLPVIGLPGVGETLVPRYQQAAPELRTKATLDLCFYDPARVHPQRMAEAVDEVRRRDALPYASDAMLQSLRGLLATYYDRGRERPWKLAESVRCPVLLVYGRRDKLVDSRAAHRVTRHFPHAEVVIIRDCGHVAQMEHPELVAASWELFRSSLRGLDTV